MPNEMKVIMERWERNVLNESASQPTTWGELGQNIILNIAAEKYPRIAKSLIKFGFKIGINKLKGAYKAVEELEDVLDWIPDEWQQKLEQGSEKAAEWLAGQARDKGGRIGAFIVDDLIGMDDSLTKNLAGYSQLNIEDEYEKLVDKQKLKKWAIGVIRKAKQMAVDNPNEPLPDLNKELEDWFQANVGAHPDTDEPDIRQGNQ
jgi:hypothetical protein